MSPASKGLIIDDVDVALSRLSSTGQEILRAPMAHLRDEIYRFVDRYAWQVARYESFARWAEEESKRYCAHWLVLDPFFAPVVDSGRFVRVRTSRQRNSTIPPVEIDPGAANRMRGSSIGIIDDAASSGRTLMSVVASARAVELDVSTVLVCASSRVAHQRITGSMPVARWREFIVGDFEVVHLRDGFPFLPFSGRPTDQSQLTFDAIGPVMLRTSAAHAHGNPWYILQRDAGIASAIQDARYEVERSLDDLLGRSATVSDLRLLGADVNIFVEPDASPIDRDTTLARLRSKA